MKTPSPTWVHWPLTLKAEGGFAHHTHSGPHPTSGVLGSTRRSESEAQRSLERHPEHFIVSFQPLLSFQPSNSQIFSDRPTLPTSPPAPLGRFTGHCPCIHCTTGGVSTSSLDTHQSLLAHARPVLEDLPQLGVIYLHFSRMALCIICLHIPRV